MGAAEFHAQAIPEMVLVGHGSQQISAGLELQGDVALEFLQKTLLELGEGALAVEQIADEQEGERAEAEKGHAHRPLVALRMDEDQRIHEAGQAAGEDEHKDSGEDGELEVAAL